MLGRANGIPLVHTKSMTIISVKEEKKNGLSKSDRSGLECQLSPCWFWVLGEAICCPGTSISSLASRLKIAVRIEQNHLCVVPAQYLEHS